MRALCRRSASLHPGIASIFGGDTGISADTAPNYGRNTDIDAAQLLALSKRLQVNYTPKSNTRNHNFSTVCARNAVFDFGVYAICRSARYDMSRTE
eukprot:1363897-Rhodomonas_salina.6